MDNPFPYCLQTLRSTLALSLLGFLLLPTLAVAATLSLNWTDTSTNEDGFTIERKADVTGTFTYVTSVGPNIHFYVDSSLVDGLTYCYRVQAYNAAGVSPYSNEACQIATFLPHPKDKVGIFRPSTGQWYLDINGNGVLDDCSLGGCISSFGQPQHLPVVGDWTGNGSTLLGVFDPGTRLWQLDGNGNDSWEGCAVDLCFGPLWMRHGLPVTGRWAVGLAKDAIGLFYPKTRVWRVDKNGDSRRNLCRIDGCFAFGRLRGLPVVGDWTGSTTSKIGVFDPTTGLWKLDHNGNGKFDSCTVDLCLGPFGSTGNLPIAGDWNGTGQASIGIYEPTTGAWQLDANGDGLFENCTADLCLGPFGQPGDVPVVGHW